MAPLPPDIEIFADAEYTTYPQNGESYEKLYVRVNKEFSFANNIDDEKDLYLYGEQGSDEYVRISITFTYKDITHLPLVIDNELGGGRVEGVGVQSEQGDNVVIQTQGIEANSTVARNLVWYEGTRTGFNWSEFGLQ